MKIYTYYEEINFKHQYEILEHWKNNWKNKGFEPVILTEMDAKRSSYYDTFLNEIQQLHLEITSKEIKPYGISCYLRWLAYSTQEDPSFFVSDYDVFNINFKNIDEPDDKLNFLAGNCPCFARGNPVQFLSFCEDIIKYSKEYKEEIKKEFKIKNCRHYHDQEFLFLLRQKVKEIYNIVSDKKYVELYEYGKKQDARLYHVAHISASIAKNNSLEYSDKNLNEIRLNLIKKIIN
jgi:hypothetical protein